MLDPCKINYIRVYAQLSIVQHIRMSCIMGLLQYEKKSEYKGFLQKKEIQNRARAGAEQSVRG